ncbi:MAG: hypothetical protein K8S55_14760, partial [Phycisphaerae bacterium]|nr:hypothetical protein [Phycisphaerae bacterium]
EPAKDEPAKEEPAKDEPAKEPANSDLKIDATDKGMVKPKPINAKPRPMAIMPLSEARKKLKATAAKKSSAVSTEKKQDTEATRPNVSRQNIAKRQSALSNTSQSDYWMPSHKTAKIKWEELMQD